ncbi:MAG TPA: hypothetical protein VM282_22420 [Acidimicrobiales bacterium]|nr:hypothetical protein [Acidimicrobiales bacterium]
MRIGCGLTTDQWKQYQLFGFVVLRGWLTQTETAALRDEALQCLRPGYGPAIRRAAVAERDGSLRADARLGCTSDLCNRRG